jgi:5-(hydroxymethyl)furfural/furfural oxidase
MHGKDGPVPIRRTPQARWAPLSKAVHAYAAERQIQYIADMNADFRDGYGSVPMCNWPLKRASAAICYLDAATRARSNLTVMTGAAATDFVLDGKRVAGVVVRVNGEVKTLSGSEIILSLGGIHSPAFLMRQGIGPAEHLRQHGIAVRADLPGVGRNLSNHALVFVGLFQKRGQRQAEDIRPHPMTAFRYSSGLPGTPAADMYMNVQCKTSWSPLGHQVANLSPTLLKPKARGRVSLKSNDAPEPLVEFNFAGEEVDLQRFMQGFRKAVEILAHDRVRAMSTVTFPVKFHDRLRQLNRRNPKNIVQSAIVAKLIDLVPPLAEPIFGTLADRKVNLQELVADDEALAEHIRENVAGTFHPCGTCRMSDDMADRHAVTDTKGRLRGFEGVRVVDASVMPTAPRGNTFVPTVMLAEKMSAAISAP